MPEKGVCAGLVAALTLLSVAHAAVIRTGEVFGSDGTFNGIAISSGATGSMEVNGGTDYDSGPGMLVGGGVTTTPVPGANGSLTVTGASSAVRIGPPGVLPPMDLPFFSHATNEGSATGLIENGGLVDVRAGADGGVAAIGFGAGTGVLNLSNGTLNVVDGAFLSAPPVGAFAGATTSIILGWSAAGFDGATEGTLSATDGSTINVVGARTTVSLGVSHDISPGAATDGTAPAEGRLDIHGGSKLNVVSKGSVAEAFEAIPLSSQTNGEVATLDAGRGAGAVGSITVSGTGTEASVFGSSGLVTIGSDLNGATGDGNGTLTVTDNAIVTVGGEDADTSFFYIGLRAGNGDVLIENGGQVIVDGEVGVAQDSSLGGPAAIEAILSTGGGSGATNSGSLIVNDTGSLTATEVVIGADGIAGGTGTFNVGVVTVNGGIFAPGSSTGTAIVEGDFLMNDGTLLIELGGLTAGLFDVLDVRGNVNLLGGEILFDFVDGFLPTINDMVDFLLADSVFIDPLVTFGFRGVAEGFDFSVDSIGGAGLRFTALKDGVAVPEPATLALMTLGLAGLGFRRRLN